MKKAKIKDTDSIFWTGYFVGLISGALILFVILFGLDKLFM